MPTKCIHDGCNTRPNYNIEGSKEALYCKIHKTDTMIDVMNKKCIHNGCNTRPHYNIEGSKKALYCKTHKTDTMVNVIDKRCIHDGCNTRPHYNIEGSKPLYCATHKTDTMIDVKNKKCIHDGCNTRPLYNIEGNKNPLYCKIHKTNTMVDVKNKKCIHDGCIKRRTYNIQGNKIPLYCETHKSDIMVNVVSKKCRTEMCDIIVLKKNYKGYCVPCFMSLYPDEPVSRNYKVKEYAVVEYVKNNFPELSWIYNKRVYDGCSKRMPDLFLDLGDKVLIVEIDENQHIEYDCSCENKRIMELSLDLNHRPIIFIRFNPDKYKNNGKVISSCWGINGYGICVVKKQGEWLERLGVLRETINYWINNSSDKNIEQIPLFYDCL